MLHFIYVKYNVRRFSFAFGVMHDLDVLLTGLGEIHPKYPLRKLAFFFFM